MEIELKYRVEDQGQWGTLVHSPFLAGMMEGEPWEKRMLAVYYDTPDGSLRRMGAAYRVRLEGDRYVATIKRRQEEGAGAMSQRLEWNVSQPDERPNPDAFAEGQVQSGDSLEELAPILTVLKEQGVREMGRTDFIRRSAVVQWQGMRADLCLDQGHLCANNRQSPILELELELLEGGERQIRQLGEQLSQRYGLRPEPRSKYARVLMLLDGQDVE